MNNYTPSQLKEHLQWLYRQPNYYKEKNNWGGKRETNKDIIRIHEEWAKENGYRDNE